MIITSDQEFSFYSRHDLGMMSCMLESKKSELFETQAKMKKTAKELQEFKKRLDEAEILVEFDKVRR